MDENIYSIYLITNKINGKKYVGFTNDPKRRWKDHRSRNSVIGKALRKYGRENFSFEIIYQSKDAEHCLSVMEPYFIAEHDAFNNGYNISTGGDGAIGAKLSEEIVEVIRKAMVKYKWTIVYEDGRVDTTLSLRQYAKERGLSESSLRHVFKGSYKKHKNNILKVTRELIKKQVRHLDE